MLDIIGAMIAGALYAAIAGVLISLAPISAAARLLASAAAMAWLAVVISLASSGLLVPGVTGPVPLSLVIFTALLALLFGSWAFGVRVHQALLSLPLPALVALNVGRIGGVFFLLLYADGRLSAPFAPLAGGGDIITGILAIPLAAMLASPSEIGRNNGRFWTRFWNAFGTLDLIVAVSLAALSIPGTPYRLFTEGAGTRVMTTLPWALVPLFLVPIYLLIHRVIAAKLRQLPQDITSVAVAT